MPYTHGWLAARFKDVARRQLLAYCKTDTLVMVRLHEILADMAAGRWQSRGNLPC